MTEETAELLVETPLEYPVVKKSHSRPYDDYVYFYIQSQSKRAWATYETKKREGKGYIYNDSSLLIKTRLTSQAVERLDSIMEHPYEGIPVRLAIMEVKEDYNVAYDFYSKKFDKMGAITFRNVYKDDPFLLAVGYFEEESITHLVQKGYEGVRIDIFTSTKEAVDEIIYLCELF